MYLSPSQLLVEEQDQLISVALVDNQSKRMKILNSKKRRKQIETWISVGMKENTEFQIVEKKTSMLLTSLREGKL